MSNVALVILFNHNYEANIEKLKKLYQPRFSNIYFIMPFYRGNDPQVIAVYENSFYFQGYIAKALEQLSVHNYDHYMFVGDDLILNPSINEHNYKESFSITHYSGFMPDIFLLTDLTQTSPNRPFAPYWPGIVEAARFTVKQRGIEISKFLPSYEEAKNKLARHGLHFTPKLSLQFALRPLKKIPFTKADFEYKKRVIKNYTVNIKDLLFKRRLQYPLVGAYSDLCIVPNGAVKDMIAYCGTFAALNLFVEVALPTAFALSVPAVSTEATLGMHGLTLWNPTTVGAFEKKYQSDLGFLFANFPERTLYIHPIKLSRWKLSS
ncbi:MAG TPA: hypothetical protein VL307_13870 [Chitinophagaceae bacterium]|nr:hypothetical protein [Chitinophagaceae bacterium]